VQLYHFYLAPRLHALTHSIAPSVVRCSRSPRIYFPALLDLENFLQRL
jgi:hypothetical protein